MFKLEDVFVVPGEGVKIPLPVDGRMIPGVGASVPRSIHVSRRLRTGDLIEGDDAKALAATRQAELEAAEKAAAEADKAAQVKAKPADEAKVAPAAVPAKLQPDAAKTEK